ncbi:MAG: TrmB family transcriptional regulator [Fibrobacterota bacterium]
MVVNNIKSNLMELGFSEYEAKAYIALIMENPSTAYEIAKRSAIPSSKIYEVLSRLKERGAVFETDASEKRKYLPIPANELVATHKTRIDSTLADLKSGLNALASNTDLSFLRTITVYAQLIDKAKQVINDASQTLLVSLWPHEMALLRLPLEAALTRDVKIAIVHFGETDTPVGKMYCHPLVTTIQIEHGGRSLIVCADSDEVVFARIASLDNAEGLHSTSRGFVTMAEDFIRHDIYVMKIVNRFGIELTNTFGENYELLRNVFKDDTL